MGIEWMTVIYQQSEAAAYYVRGSDERLY